MPAITRNTLFYGDNLPILREYIDSESVDLIYLDPPFNSNRSYNVLFREEGGKESEAQITAFEDTWHWNAATEETYHELVTLGEPHIASMVSALRQFIGTNQMMAYLVMMAARLVELHRVLKPTGSLYLHCDPTASHYLKIILDTVFGSENFVNELVWMRSGPRGHAFTRYPSTHDILFFYAKGPDRNWNTQYVPHREDYIKSHYGNVEPETGRRYTLGDCLNPNPDRPNLTYEWNGKVRTWRWTKDKMQELHDEGRLYYTRTGMPRYKRYLDEMPGSPVTSVWTDIPPINSQAAERLGYPTQKPQTLLERIIQASSNPGDVVLDPFCGCGTAIAAAEKLGRRWIGIDITHLSIALQKYRLKDSFELEAGQDYVVKGEPEDLPSAQQLAQDNRFQFEWWALSLVKARPSGAQAGSRRGKKGADKGIDGVIMFIDDSTGKAKRIIVQVKSGHVKSGDIRDLRGTISRTKAAMGVFITLEPPSQAMEKEAVSAGFYRSPGWGKDYSKLQILTIADLLDGEEVKMPPTMTTFRQAGKAERDKAVQEPLL